MKVLYTKAEAARALGMSVRALERLHADGKIAYRRDSPTARPRIHHTEIESYADSLESF